MSTVGQFVNSLTNKIDTIGYNRYYETMAFYGKEEPPYIEADVTREIDFNSSWMIDHCERGTDAEANEMHERVVKEIGVLMESGRL